MHDRAADTFGGGIDVGWCDRERLPHARATVPPGRSKPVLCSLTVNCQRQMVQCRMARRLSLLAIGVVALCGCGGAGASTTAATTGATASTAPTSSSTPSSTGADGNGGGRQLTAAQQQALQAYRDCMAQNGVTLPAGTGFGGFGGRGAEAGPLRPMPGRRPIPAPHRPVARVHPGRCRPVSTRRPMTRRRRRVARSCRRVSLAEDRDDRAARRFRPT